MPRARRPAVRRGALVILALATALLVGGAIELLRIRADVNGGRSALTELSLDRLGGGLVGTIDGAAARLERADRIARRSPLLAPLRAVPVLGNQVDAVRDLTDAAAELGTSARAAALAIDEDLQRAGGEPAARLELLETVSTELDRIEAEVAAIDIGAEGWLVGPLREARADLVAELQQVPERFDEARSHVDALATLLRGPNRYLVLAANNAEMRGGAGMPLSGGVATFRGGDVDFGDFESLANRHTAQVVDAAGREIRDTYHQFRIGQSWLQTAVSPNFEEVAPIYAAMSARFSTGPVDGVLEVDAVALRHLLEVIGPVELDGITYTAENIEAEILNENYLRFDDQTDRAARQDVQGRLASAIFDALKERDVDVPDLALGLRTAARGRHLLAWSDDAAVQAIWESVGATGALPDTGLMVTAQNIAANKLDWYIQPRVTVTARPQLGSTAWKVRLSTAIENPERERTSPAVESARREPEYRDGVHRVLLAVYLPEAAYDIRTLDLPFTETGPDGPLHMVGKRAFIEEGESVNLAVEFSLPPEHIGVLVLPSGRVRPIPYDVNGVTVTDAAVTPVLFVEPPADEPSAGLVVAAILALGTAGLLVATTWDGRRRLLRLR